MDDFLVDLYYYFDKSTKRKAELAGIQIPFYEACTITPRSNIINFIPRVCRVL